MVPPVRTVASVVVSTRFTSPLPARPTPPLNSNANAPSPGIAARLSGVLMADGLTTPPPTTPATPTATRAPAVVAPTVRLPAAIVTMPIGSVPGVTESAPTSASVLRLTSLTSTEMPMLSAPP